MGKIKIPYYVVVKGCGYWRPKKEMRALGFERIKCGEAVDGLETVRIRKGGAPVEVSLTVSPIRDETGRVVGASRVARDITRRKAEEAERLNLIKDLTSALTHIH